jgi:hypothetical protein
MARRRDNLIAFRTREGSALEALLFQSRERGEPIKDILHHLADLLAEKQEREARK